MSIIEKIDYLFSKINWGASFLDAEAIQIKNSLKDDISNEIFGASFFESSDKTERLVFLKIQYQWINVLARTICESIYSYNIPDVSMWELGVEFENGKIRNVDFYKCLLAAIEVYKHESKSEFNDLLVEFKNAGLLTITL